MYESSKRITHIAIVNGKDCSLDYFLGKTRFYSKHLSCVSDRNWFLYSVHLYCQYGNFGYENKTMEHINFIFKNLRNKFEKMYYSNELS